MVIGYKFFNACLIISSRLASEDKLEIVFLTACSAIGRPIPKATRHELHLNQLKQP